MTLPKQPSIEDIKTRRAIDRTLHKCVEQMHHEMGAPISLIIDRLLTYALVTSISGIGSKETARRMRLFTERVDSGLLDAKHPKT
ncbi:hypothetical protein [Ahrensia kielensis]|uniref:hypothetical protein n=1 Tax=Ahrensia kielensis TaxID=76980 RepID=UPI00035F4DE0|nr:hypothetical protein [Ahrensia kielensis]